MEVGGGSTATLKDVQACWKGQEAKVVNEDGSYKSVVERVQVAVKEGLKAQAECEFARVDAKQLASVVGGSPTELFVATEMNAKRFSAR